jgi:integrase
MSAKITESTVKSAVPPGAGSTSVWDDEITGFGLRVHAKGTKSFFFDYRVNGRGKRIAIGKYTGPQGAWTAAAARARAKELRKLVDAGADPAGDKRERREAATIQDLIDRYIADHLPKLACKGEDDPRHKDTKRMLSEIGEHLGVHTLVKDVHGGDVRDMHRKITESGRPVRANRILAVCSKMFSLSLVPKAGENKPWRNAVDGNPCKGIEKNHEDEAGRLYTQAELSAIATALGEYPGVAADCVLLVMVTGCRPIEAMRAKWTEFEVEPQTWVKPSAHTKQRKTHHLPLSPPAIKLIERLRAERAKAARRRKAEEGERPDSPYVFPGDVPGEHIAALWHVWHFVRERATVLLWGDSDDEGIAKVVADLRTTLQREPSADECLAAAKAAGVELPIGLLGKTKETMARLYDCRHTFASLGAGGGLSLPIIGRLLGHTQARTTQRYARHLADDPVRAAATKITNNAGFDNVNSIGQRP